MRVLLLPVICWFLLCGCNSGNNTGTSNSDTSESAPVAPPQPTAAPASKLGDSGTHALLAVVKNYYDLKNALVAAKQADALQAANQLGVTAAGFKDMLAKDSGNVTVLQPFIDTIILETKQVAEANDASCERQRLPFGTISSAMFGLLKSADLKHAAIYREYCPMAFNEKGAYWLSDDPDIKNPYFGKKMLECGEVTDSLK